MTCLKITIEARTWRNRLEGRADQARRTRIASLLRDIAGAIEIGSTGNTLQRPDLVGEFTLELPPAPSRDAA